MAAKTWEKILYKGDKSGAIDLAVDPHNSNVMFAALYQIQRTPWSLESGGPGSGLYRSTTVKFLEAPGSERPAGGHSGRIGVSVSGADSNRVYALIESKQSGCIVPMMVVKPGPASMMTSGSRSAPGTSRIIFADPKSADTVTC